MATTPAAGFSPVPNGGTITAVGSGGVRRWFPEIDVDGCPMDNVQMLVMRINKGVIRFLYLRAVK